LSEKQKFEEIIQEIRSDFGYIRQLLSKLSDEVYEKRRLTDDDTSWIEKGKEIGNWITDVYIDKVLETYSKINKFLTELGIYSIKTLMDSKQHLVDWLQKMALNASVLLIAPVNIRLSYFEKFRTSLQDYEQEFEKAMVLARTRMYNTNWAEMKKVQSEDYILMERSRYLTARQELEKAKEAVKNRQWEEVLNHLRPAIDLAIAEKFGFKKIKSMKQFLDDAITYGLPLPTYDTVYYYYNEGSQRIHGGKLNTAYECQRALEFVAGFIDQLDLIDISKEKIEEFKQKYKCVE
jgi:hypothetical protein